MYLGLLQSIFFMRSMKNIYVCTKVVIFKYIKQWLRRYVVVTGSILTCFPEISVFFVRISFYLRLLGSKFFMRSMKNIQVDTKVLISEYIKQRLRREVVGTGYGLTCCPEIFVFFIMIFVYLKLLESIFFMCSMKNIQVDTKVVISEYIKQRLRR